MGITIVLCCNNLAILICHLSVSDKLDVAIPLGCGQCNYFNLGPMIIQSSIARKFVSFI